MSTQKKLISKKPVEKSDIATYELSARMSDPKREKYECELDGEIISLLGSYQNYYEETYNKKPSPNGMIEQFILNSLEPNTAFQKWLVKEEKNNKRNDLPRAEDLDNLDILGTGK